MLRFGDFDKLVDDFVDELPNSGLLQQARVRRRLEKNTKWMERNWSVIGVLALLLIGCVLELFGRILTRSCGRTAVV